MSVAPSGKEDPVSLIRGWKWIWVSFWASQANHQPPFESMFLPVPVLSIFPTYCLRKPGPLLRCIWSLRSGSPEEKEHSFTLLPLFTTQKAALVLTLLRTRGRIIIRPQALKFFSHGVWISLCQNKKERQGKERQTIAHPTFHMDDFLWGCWEK